MGKKSVHVQYKIRRIKDLSFFIDEDKEISPEKISIDLKFNFNVSSDKEQIDLIVEAIFNEVDNQSVFMSGKVLTSFIVKDMVKFKNKDENIDLPEDTLTTLFSLSITHARALMAKAAMGSKYNGLYIPIIKNPGQLLKKLMKGEKE